MSKELSIEVVATKILFIRGKKVMLDRDLAQLYGVSTKRLLEQVKRNMKRFPTDFSFPLARQEVAILRSQFATSSWGGRRYVPHVFTQEGVAMLSGVLNSERSIEVNIAIMRAFVKLRELLLSHKELADKIEALERSVGEHDEKIALIFEAIKKLLGPAPTAAPAPQKPPIGFRMGTRPQGRVPLRNGMAVV